MLLKVLRGDLTLFFCQTASSWASISICSLELCCGQTNRKWCICSFGHTEANVLKEWRLWLLHIREFQWCCCFAIPDQGHSICAHIGGSCALALAADSAKGAGLTAQLWEVRSCSCCFIFSIPCFALQYSWKKLEMPSFCMSALKAVLFCIDFWGASACQSLIIVKYVIYE